MAAGNAGNEVFLERRERRLTENMKKYRASNVPKGRKIREIRMYLEKYREVAPEFSPRRYEKIMAFLTDDELDIDDSALTIEALETFFFIHADRPKVFICLPQGYALETVLEHARKEEFDFWGVRTGTSILANRFNPVVDCFTAPNILHNTCLDVGLILKYGFRYAFKFYIYMDRCVDFQYRGYLNYEVWHHHGVARMIMDKRKYEMLLIMDTFSAFAGEPSTKMDRIKALSYIFRSIPDPYVTPTKMYEEITRVANRRFRPYLYAVFTEYRSFRNEETEYFEQKDETRQPRKLMHLCRCHVRNVLADLMRLPNGIERLKVPDTVKEYLNLDS